MERAEDVYLGKDTFKRKQDSFLKNTKKNCLIEEGLDLVNAVPEDAIRIKE